MFCSSCFRSSTPIICSLLIGAGILLAANAGEPPAASKPSEPAAKTPAAKDEPKGEPYTLATCIVSGEKLGSMGKPVVKQIDGREVRFCCSSCVAEFEKDKANWNKKLDAKIIEQQLPHYPLKNCVVQQDDSLDEGSPVDFVYKNRLVRFCCGDCTKRFKTEPAKYLARLNEAVIKEQKPHYPMQTCPVSGEPLGDKAVDHVVGVSLVRFCCEKCIAEFEKDPLPVLAKVHEAWTAKGPKLSVRDQDGTSAWRDSALTASACRTVLISTTLQTAGLTGIARRNLRRS